MKNLVLSAVCFIALGYFAEQGEKKEPVVVVNCDYVLGEVVCK